VAAITLLMLLLRRQILTPDYLLVLFIPVALLTGRALTFLRDWVPLAALLFAWEAMRAFAGNTGFAVYQGTWQLEEAMFGGRLPTVVMQNAARFVGWQGWLDPLTTAIYFMHFPAALGFALMLWLADRAVFLQYIATLLAMSFAAFIVFLLFPTAPPWWAAYHGDFAGMDRIFAHTLVSHLDSIYASLAPNPVAAIPSLHAAYPFLGFLALRRVWPRAAWLALGWAVLVWLTVVYLGEHYVVDVVAGIAWAGLFWTGIQGLAGLRSRLGRTPELVPELAEA
jgi:hypothetical protein